MMLRKIFQPASKATQIFLKFRFGSSVSWKKIRQKTFQRDQYYNEHQMQAYSLRVEAEKFKIYIGPRSPQVIRTGESNYCILEDSSNFNLTFLQNLDFMGKQFSWNNRKNIGVSFRNILQMENVSLQKPVIIIQEYQTTFNNETSAVQKQLKIQLLQQNQRNVKLSFSIWSQKGNDKWLGEYQLEYSDYVFLVQSAKKNIYYSSGLKTMIELQKRQIIKKMEQRVYKNLQKQIKSSIQFDGIIDDDKIDLLNEMEQFEQSNKKQKKPKTKK